LEAVVRSLGLLIASVSVLSIATAATTEQRGERQPQRQTAQPAGQRGGAQPVGHGYIPPRGPAPVRRAPASPSPAHGARPAAAPAAA